MELQLLHNNCRSPWCKKCAKVSPTHGRIQTRLERMDWRSVRHVILTVSREYPAQGAYTLIRKHRSIPRLMAALNLKGRQWLWVLEWHADGWPHWHVLVESDRGMIGKKRIDLEWGWGWSWESYIRDADHWAKIKGYHRSKGYLAGEGKAHQLELPAWLLTESRVRKFSGSQFNPTGYKKAASRSLSRRKRPAAYADRFASCGDGCKLRVCAQIADTATPYKTAAVIASSNLQPRARGRFEGERAAVIKTALEIMALGGDLVS